MAILDARGNLFVDDSANDRILEFDHAETGTGLATRVFGQRSSGDNFLTNCSGVGPSALNFPFQIALDQTGDLLVADPSNYRAVVFDQPIPTPTPTRTPTAIPTRTATSKPTATRTPTAVATGTPTRTATHTATAGPSRTPAPTATHTATAAASRSPSPTASRIASTPTRTATHTVTLTASRTQSPTPTRTATQTPAHTTTRTPTVTPTPGLRIDSVTSPIRVGGEFTIEGEDLNSGAGGG
jgi:hypothetical protein